jgi:integrase
VTALRAHRARQLQERLSMGNGYVDDDLVVTVAGGRFLHPKDLSPQFKRTVARLGLPPIRLHDLRHSHATHALRAGVHPRIVQERLGHANVGITLDTYSHVDLDMQAAAAEQIAALMSGEAP